MEDQKYFTLSQIQKSKELKTVENGLAEYTEKAKSLVITDSDNFGAAADFCKNIKQAARAIENKRKFFIDPYNLVVKNINTLFKTKTKALNDLEFIVKRKMIDYNQDQERLARIEQEKIDKANAKKEAAYQAKLKAQAESEKPKKIKEPVYKEPEIVPEKTNRTMNTTTSIKKITKWRVLDIKKIPREYLEVNEKKVGAMVKAGIEIPGVEIYQEDSLAIR